MKLKVRDLLNIPIFKDFKVVAGAGGLDKPIVRTETLDFEFIHGANMTRDNVFDGESITLTSFLFAKDNPDLILEAVKKLDSLKVSCLAYKAALFSKLPDEVLEYADSHDFPIMEFGGDEFFEDVIYAVKETLDEGEDIVKLEHEISKVIEQELSPREEYKLCKKINIDFKKYLRVVAIKDRERTEDDQIIALVRKMHESEKLNRKAALCKYKDMYFLILSQDERDKSRFNALFTDISLGLQLNSENLCCGISTIKATEQFGKVLREAFWACNIASMENVPSKFYDELGIYKLVAPEISSSNTIEFMEDYLAPILNDEPDLLETACTYILARGSLDKTAEDLFCHKNTIRYRLSKIQQMLDPLSNDKEFHENLSIAVRIYLLSKFL